MVVFYFLVRLRFFHPRAVRSSDALAAQIDRNVRGGIWNKLSDINGQVSARQNINRHRSCATRGIEFRASFRGFQ